MLLDVHGVQVVVAQIGNDVAVRLQEVIGKSFSLSRELRRRSQTRSLLGDATSAASVLQKEELPIQRLLAINKRPTRLFLGEGSTSVSEKSEKSEFVAADSEPLSTNIGIGDAVVVRRR